MDEGNRERGRCFTGPGAAAEDPAWGYGERVEGAWCVGGCQQTRARACHGVRSRIKHCLSESPYQKLETLVVGSIICSGIN